MSPQGGTVKHLVLVLAMTAMAACNAEHADDATPPSADATSPTADTAPPPSSDGTTATPSPHDSDATIPLAFQGDWAANAAACASAGHESRLSIGSDHIRFQESSGTIKSVASGPTDITIVAILTGEGETREATYRFRLSADGTTLADLGSGTGMVRRRCI